MTITLVLLGLSSALLASSFRFRTRENQRTEALADSQRGLNLITREIANSGYGLTDNGIVGADTGLTSIRVRANLNASEGETTSNSATDKDEDVKFLLYTIAAIVTSFVSTLTLRLRKWCSQTESIPLNFRYYPDKVFTQLGSATSPNVVDAAGNAVSEVTQKSEAKYVVISVCVTLPAVGTPGSAGYQPPSRVQFVSDAALRNSDLVNY